MYSVMALILGGLMLSGCGDGLSVATYRAESPQPNPQAYQACLSRNPNYYGSPAWYYWNEQCRIRWAIPQPYGTNYVNQVDR